MRFPNLVSLSTLVASFSLLLPRATLANNYSLNGLTNSPAFIAGDVPVTYFGPPPPLASEGFIGPLQLLSGKIDLNVGTITIPLYSGAVLNANKNGYISGKSIWYILTDTSNETDALSLGINYAAKLKLANVGRGARFSRKINNVLEFTEDSFVDFSPVQAVRPGNAPNYFPPLAVTPGSVGNTNYSPATYVQNAGNVHNAPVVASPNATASTSTAAGCPRTRQV